MLTRITSILLFLFAFVCTEALAGYQLPEGWEIIRSGNDKSTLSVFDEETTVFTVFQGGELGLSQKIDSEYVQISVRFTVLPKQEGSSCAIYFYTNNGVLLKFIWERTPDGPRASLVTSRHGKQFFAKSIPWTADITTFRLLRKNDYFTAVAEEDGKSPVKVGGFKWPGLSKDGGVGIVAEYKPRHGAPGQQHIGFTDLYILSLEGMVAEAEYVLRMGDYNRSEWAIGYGMQLFGEHARFFLLIASMYQANGGIDKMITALEKAVALDDKSTKALSRLGFALIEHGRNQDTGLGYLNRAVDLEPDNVVCLDNLGWGYFKQGDITRARAALEKGMSVVRKQPAELSLASIGLFEHIDQLYTAQKDLSAKTKHLDEVIGLLRNLPAPQDDPYLRSGLGWFLFRAGRLQEAVRETEQALAQIEQSEVYGSYDSVVQKRAGDIYSALNQKGKAFDSYTRALENSQRFHRIRETSEIKNKMGLIVQ